MSATVYRYDRGRLARNLVGLLPLAGFPVAVHLTGHADPVLYGLFGLGAAALVGGVLFAAGRFKLVVGETELEVRGRVRHRRIRYTDILEIRVRRGREKAARFMGPPPFRELVMTTRDQKRLVVSSLPLGEEGFEEVVRALLARAPADASE